MLTFDKRLAQDELRVAAFRSVGTGDDPGGKLFAGQLRDDDVVSPPLFVGQLQGFIDLDA
jgi:hypothetical protein